jgi:hypothetical protein
MQAESIAATMEQRVLSSFPQGGPPTHATGLCEFAMDYTPAPHADWQEVTDQVVTVFQELLKRGYDDRF